MPGFGKTRNGGSKRTAPFYSIIGPPPQCEQGDTAKAQEYADKIQAALARGSWSPTHANRLRELRRLWAFRASGLDMRFNLVGTKDGRLPLEVETVIKQARDAQLKGLKTVLKPQDLRRRPRHEWGTGAKATGYSDGGSGGIDGMSDGEEPEAGTPWTGGAREYLIPGQDTHGHSVRIWCRVMPAHHRALSILKEHPSFGFRSIGDLFRWCVVNGIKELNDRARLPPVRSALHQAEAISKVLTDQAYYQDYAKVFEAMSGVIEKHASRGEDGQAARLVSQIRSHIESMSEPFWRDLWMTELKNRFGRFLEMAGAGFNPEDAGDE